MVTYSTDEYLIRTHDEMRDVILAQSGGLRVVFHDLDAKSKRYELRHPHFPELPLHPVCAYSVPLIASTALKSVAEKSKEAYRVCCSLKF